MTAAHIPYSRRNMEDHGLLDIRISELAYFIGFNLLLFQSALQQRFAAFGYSDEAVTLILLLSTLARALRRRGENVPILSRRERMAIVTIIAFVVSGLYGNFANKIQTAFYPIAIDVFSCCKFFVSLLFGYIVFDGSTQLHRYIINEAKILLVIMIPFAIANQFADLGMNFDSRFGFKSFQFVFAHPSSLNAAIVGILMLFMINPKKNLMWLVLCWGGMCLSLRSTGLAFAAASIALLLTSGNKRRFHAVQLALVGLISAYIGWSQIQFYFGTVRSARAELTRVSFILAKRFAPFGSGFATFGSNITARPTYYSPLYYEYGLSSIQGLTIDQSSFLSDTFWPIVIGQFGWIGFILFTIICYLLIRGVWQRLINKGVPTLPVTLGFLYLGLASFAGSSFFHPMSVYLSLSISLTSTTLLSGCRNDFFSREAYTKTALYTTSHHTLLLCEESFNAYS